MGFRTDRAQLNDAVARIGAEVGAGDGLRWMCHTRVEKFHVDEYHAGLKPYDVLDVPGNLLLYGGADVLWLALRDALTASTGQKNTKYNNANAAILIGDSTAAVLATQVDLQASSGATHRLVQGMDSTYPLHTTGASTAANSVIAFKATFSSGSGNFTNGIREWGIGNKVSQAKAYPGRLLNRKVQNLGTKTSAGVWALTLSLSLA